MLLRSITKHVKDQNWFAVALDFFIVVAGILIAFQITNWDQRRAARSEFNLAVQRLQDEMAANISLLEIHGAELDPKLQMVEEAINILRSCEGGPENQKKITKALRPVEGWIILLLEEDALAEITETPYYSRQLTQMERQELEKLKTVKNFLISEAEAAADELAVSDIKVEESPLVLRGELKPETGVYQGVELTDMRRNLYIDAPVSVACKDRLLLEVFYDWQRQHEAQRTNISVLRETYENYVETVERLTR